jgi:putative lipoic acid-binding regulatory protein
MQIHQNPFGKNEKIKFPVNYDLKIILIANNKHKENIASIELVLEKLDISFLNWRHKDSGKGKYTSYTVHVRVSTEALMKTLYAELRTVPGFKMAI